jgi:hypothetical protein
VGNLTNFGKLNLIDDSAREMLFTCLTSYSVLLIIAITAKSSIET